MMDYDCLAPWQLACIRSAAGALLWVHVSQYQVRFDLLAFKHKIQVSKHSQKEA
jgi:hypothetical protein